MPDSPTEKQQSAGISAAIFGADMAQFLVGGWRHKGLIFLTLLAAWVLAILYLRNTPYQYSATLKVTPAQQDSKIPSNLTGLASLAGIAVPGGKGGSSLALYVETLKGREVAETLATNPKVMQRVFADQWDAASQTWRPRRGLLPGLAQLLNSITKRPPESSMTPGAASLQKYLSRKLKISEDSKSGVTLVMLENPDPKFAALLVEQLHAAADAQLRARALLRAQNYIAYLERKLPIIDNADQRKALVESLGDQERIQMFASSSTPYAAEPLGKTLMSVRPTTPNPAIVLSVASVLGLLAGFLLAWLATARHQQKQAADA